MGPVSPLAAQSADADPAVLVADDVTITSDRRLVASGNVEALYDGRRLTARSVTYDRTTERLVIEGPITLSDGDYTTVLADAAELDRDLQNGILRGARVVMDDQLQMAAVQANTVNGRYTQLYKAAVTSCQVCHDGGLPLWQIRARRVIHDREERQIYLDDAQFRVLDTPIMYIPRLRLPDPTLERATGFLVPSLKNSTLLGFGAKIPYFVRLGDDKDITFTPYISTETRTLEWRYRQAFRNGGIEFEGALSKDDIGRPRSFRNYVAGAGAFALKRDFVLRFDVELVNDDTYLVDYDYSGKDRLDSEISVERVRRDEWVHAALTHFRSLRAGEADSTLPTVVGNADYERRVFPARIGGELRFAAALHSHYRSSDDTTDGPDLDIYADGRDVTRLTGSADWLRTWTLMGGVRSSVQTGLAFDATRVHQAGTTSASQAAELTPSAAVTLRWPWARRSAGSGVTNVIEPVMQLAWVGGSDPDIPNDESTRVEFDEGNLLSLSRFPETDRRERGVIAAYGLSWARINPNGLQTRLSVGQVWRDARQLERTGASSFSDTSGQQGHYSDVLVAAQVATQNGLSLTARGLFDDQFDTTKAELRGTWQNARTDLSATYVWLGRDPAENRPGTISEWAFDASYRLSRHWTGSAEWRYDVASDESVKGGVGLTYTNECVDISLKASRRFTSSTILTPSTDISLTVGLRGFATRTADKSYVRTCRK
ncbi:LPS assembly protein LptD [Roseovarius sp. SCSIO 43702]|nr:LPS assembly protein LptD [Roseovarius sp. SCSIO 43702]